MRHSRPGTETRFLCGEKRKWAPCKDMLENTKAGIETYIQLSDVVAQASCSFKARKEPVLRGQKMVNPRIKPLPIAYENGIHRT